MNEAERRKQVIEAGETDIARWSDPSQLEAAWEARAAAAATFIHAGTRVLDIGCGAMALERHLPFATTYQPCDVVGRDARTIVADLNASGPPLDAVRAADLVVMLGVWEYLFKPDGVFRAFAATGKPILCSYCDAALTPDVDRRRSLGWVNDFTLPQFLEIARAQGYHAALVRQIDPLQFLIRFERKAPEPRIARKRVHVISYYNAGNFGDRLGYHLLNDILPPHAEVTWGTIRPVSPVPPNTDVLVIGIGNSLFGDLVNDDLLAAAAKAKAAIGIFGTQYRTHTPADKLRTLIGSLRRWYARSEEDINIYARGAANVSHLGDWLINAFAMSVPDIEQPLRIGEAVMQGLPIDRTIQHIQRHKFVFSERLHPLLCALTSAESVAYLEQREFDGKEVSGKFRSMLIDIFGQAYPENKLWPVNRERVAAYKVKVRANTDKLKADLAALLA
jgi:hypothetical protein